MAQHNIKGESSSPRSSFTTSSVLVWTLIMISIMYINSLNDHHRHEGFVVAQQMNIPMMNNRQDHTINHEKPTNIDGVSKVPLQFRKRRFAGGTLSADYEEATNSVIGSPVYMDLRFAWNDSKILMEEEEIFIIDSATGIVKRLLLTHDNESNEMKPSRVDTIAGCISDKRVPSHSIPTDPFTLEIDADFVVASKKSSEIFLTRNYNPSALYSIKEGIVKKLFNLKTSFDHACKGLVDGSLHIETGVKNMFTILEGRDEMLYLADRIYLKKINLTSLEVEDVFGCDSRSFVSVIHDGVSVAKVNGNVEIILYTKTQIFRLDRTHDWAHKLELIAGNGNHSIPYDSIPENAIATEIELSPKKILQSIDGEIIVLENSNRILSIDTNKKVRVLSSASELKGLEITSIVQSYLSKELFISDNKNNVVRKIARDGTVTTVFGNGSKFYFGHMVPALKSRVNPKSIQVSTYLESDIISIVDTLDTVKIRVIDENLEIRTLFDKEFLESEVSTPEGKVLGVFRARYGQLYISLKNQIYKVYEQNTVKRIVGLKEHFSGDGGLATEAVLSEPTGIFYSKSLGSLLIADSKNRRIRSVKNGKIKTIYESKNQITVVKERNGKIIFFDGSLKELDLVANKVSTLFVLPDETPLLNDFFMKDNGDIYLCLFGSLSVLSPNGKVAQIQKEKTFYSSSIGFLSNGDAIVTSKYRQHVFKLKADGTWEQFISVNMPTGILVSSKNEIYIAHDRFISKVVDGKMVRIVGSDSPTTSFSNPLETRLVPIESLSFGESEDEIYFSETTRFVWKVSLATNTLTKVAGGLGDGLPATEAKLQEVTSFFVNVDGDMVIADTEDHVIRKVSSKGIISTLYGIPGIAGYNEETDASKAILNAPKHIHYTNNGDLFFFDSRNLIIRRISNGVIKTIVGNKKRLDPNSFKEGRRGNETNLDGFASFSISPDDQYLLFTMTGGVYCMKLGDENALIQNILSSPGLALDVSFSSDGLSFYYIEMTENYIMKAEPFCPEGFRISYKNHVCINSTTADDEDKTYGYIIPLTGIVILSSSIIIAVLFAIWYHVRKNSISEERQVREQQQSYAFLSEDEEELQTAPSQQELNEHDHDREDNQEHNLIQMDP